MSKSRFEELDALRGIAALSVACFHYTENTIWFPYFFFGSTAVDLFFIISGFVIFLSIQNTSTWVEFTKKRILRLYPTYWICVTITTIVIIVNGFYLATPNRLPLRYIINLTMFQHFFKVTDIDGPYWTLAVELMFYIFILILKKLKLLHRIEPIGWAVLAISFFLNKLEFSTTHNYYQRIAFLFPLLNRWPMFFAGILFYRCMTDKRTALRLISLVACFIFGVIMMSNSKLSFLTTGGYTFVLLIYFALILLLITNNLKFLSLKPLIFMGSISYTFYLIHQYIGLNYIIRNYRQHYAISCFVSFTISILLATIINRYLEPPVRNKLKQLLSNFGGKELYTNFTH